MGVLKMSELFDVNVKIRLFSESESRAEERVSVKLETCSFDGIFIIDSIEVDDENLDELDENLFDVSVKIRVSAENESEAENNVLEQASICDFTGVFIINTVEADHDDDEIIDRMLLNYASPWISLKTRSVATMF
jgi:preprotein translocase subunit SecB